MTWPVQQNGHNILYFLFQSPGNVPNVFFNWCIQVNTSGSPGADSNFIHIYVRCMQQTVSGSHSQNRKSIGQPFGYQICSLQRINGHIHLGRSSGTNFFANIKHWRLIHFTFADHNNTVDVYRIESHAHSFDSGIISGNFISPAHQSTGCQRRGFSNPHKLQSKFPLHGFPLPLYLIKEQSFHPGEFWPNRIENAPPQYP